MRLKCVRLQNFRSFKDATIEFDNYTCVLGPNGSGKSAILSALNVLFRDESSPTEVFSLHREDFHNLGTEQPIRITATFDKLSEKATEDLSAYVRQGSLTMSAVAEWNEKTQRADVRQVGSRMVVESFTPYFEAEKSGAKAPELKQIYSSLRGKFPDLVDAGTKDQMTASLKKLESEKPELCTLVESTDQFYGWTRGTNRLARHLMWVYVPAVKDASEEQEEGKDTVLGRLLQRTIRAKVDFAPRIDALRTELGSKYQQLIDEERGVLQEIGTALQDRLRNWSHPGARVELRWNYDRDKSIGVAAPLARAQVGEGSFLGDVVRLGHGIQRSYLVALLQEMATLKTESQPRLLLAIEEPELYQHPPQARHLASVLEAISEKDAQVFVTTHSPLFVSARGFASIRMTRRASLSAGSTVTSVTFKQVADSLASALGESPKSPTAVMATVEQILQPSQNEMFFCSLPVLVEGLEDVAFLATHLRLASLWGEFRRYGCHFIVCGGKGPMSRPAAIAQGLGIPTFIVFDADADRCKGANELREHTRDNGCLLKLMHRQDDAIPQTSLISDEVVMWRTRIKDEVANEIGTQEWNEAERAARDEHGWNEGVHAKNSLLVTATLESLWNRGKKSELLERACRSLLKYAEACASR